MTRLVLLCLVVGCLATTPHTILFQNTTSDFDLDTESFAGSEASVWFMTWDRQKLYIGIQSTDVSDSTGKELFSLYFDTDPKMSSPKDGTGSTGGLDYPPSKVRLPFSANLVVEFNLATETIYAYKWESRDWTYIVAKGGPIQYSINRQTNMFIISISHAFIGSASGQLSLTGFFVRDNGDATSCLHHFWPKVQTKSTSFVVKGYWSVVLLDGIVPNFSGFMNSYSTYTRTSGDWSVNATWAGALLPNNWTYVSITQDVVLSGSGEARYINIHGSGSLSVTETGNLTIGANGTIVADVFGPWQMNGTMNVQNSTFDFPDGGVMGALNVDGPVDLGADTVWLIKKSLKLGPKGKIFAGKLQYGNGSVLIYNLGVGSEATIGKEWTFDGVPFDVFLTDTNIQIKDNEDSDKDNVRNGITVSENSLLFINTAHGFSIPRFKNHGQTILSQFVYTEVFENDGLIMCRGDVSLYINGTRFNKPTITASRPNPLPKDRAVLLDAGPGFDGYEWSPDGQTSQSIIVKHPGVYQVTVNKNWCWAFSDNYRVDVDNSLISNDTLEPWETLADGTEFETQPQTTQQTDTQTQTPAQSEEHLISSEFWPSSLFFTVIVFGSVLICLFALVICVFVFVRRRKGQRRSNSEPSLEHILSNTDFMGESTSEQTTPHKANRSTKVFVNKDTNDEHQPLLFQSKQEEETRKQQIQQLQRIQQQGDANVRVEQERSIGEKERDVQVQDDRTRERNQEEKTVGGLTAGKEGEKEKQGGVQTNGENN